MSDILYHLKKMEEVLRLAPRKNGHAGLYIELIDDTAALWGNVLRELIAAEAAQPAPAAAPKPAAMKGELTVELMDGLTADQIENIVYAIDALDGVFSAYVSADAAPDALRERVTAALEVIERYGGIDGGHHKQWVIDQVVQVVRALTGDGYAQWLVDMANAEGGPYEDWDEGIAP